MRDYDWVVGWTHFGIALMLEVSYQDNRQQMIGYTREEHLKRSTVAIITLSPKRLVQTPVLPSGMPQWPP